MRAIRDSMLVLRSKVTPVVVWVLLAAGFVLLAHSRWPPETWLKTDFNALLPTDSSNLWQVRANAVATAAFDQQLVLLMTGDNADQLDQFRQLVNERLVGGGYVEGNVEDSEALRWRLLAERLFPYRWGLLSSADREGLQRAPAAHLEQFRRLLYSPLGSARTSSLQSDPAGTFRNYLEEATPRGDTVVDAQATELLVYRVRQQKREYGVSGDLYDIYLSLKAEAVRLGVRLSATGAPLYSAYGVRSAKQEISTIGLASMFLLIVLLVAVLRSPSAIALTLLCVASGLLGGLMLTVMLLQQIHILTLVFGATIIGIAADYAFHYLAHTDAAGEERYSTLERIFTGLSTGALTSVVAFIGLTFLFFSGIRQIGVFMAAGLLCSFLTVCLLFPALYRPATSGIRLPRFCSKPTFSSSTGWLLLLVLILAAIPGIAMLKASDDVRDFYAVPGNLADDQALIASALDSAADSRYLLVIAPDEEALLQTEERVLDAARQWIELGELGGLSGVSQLVSSRMRQQKNFALQRSAAEGGYLAAHMHAMGFPPELQNELLAEMPQEFQPLRLEVLENLSLPLGAGGFLGCVDGECASWMRISGAGTSTALESLIALEPAVELVSPVSTVNSLLSSYRSAVLTVLAVGGSVVALLLALFFGWRLALQIMLLPLASCFLSLAVTGYVGGSYSIVNLLAMLLIIGVGLDYAIFRAFTAACNQPATSLAIALSATTSILAFGMLSFSNTPLIASFGQTIAVGLSFAYLLSWFRFDPGAS